MEAILDELKIFTGNAHRGLAEDVCKYLDIPLGQAEVFKFSNDNTFVRIQENVRQRDVFIIQPTCAPVNDNLMELLIMIDACKRASAGRITAVVPYYAYGRTDKKDQPRVPITARLVADLLTALPMLSDYFQAKELSDLVVVAVDIGISKKARDVAERLHVPLAIIEKRRLGNGERTEVMNVIGDVEGKVALTFDDEIDTGGTVANAARVLAERGVKEVYCCVTHPVFSKDAADVMARSLFREVVVSDTIPMPAEKRNGKITVLPVAPLLGEAIHRIHKGLSVGEMFN